MLYSTSTAHEKRGALRALLAGPELVRFPGAFSPLSARLIERKRFDGVYISGAVVSNEIGLPDIGLTTLTEVASRAAEIARNTNLPAIADADTGFGEPMNVARTVQVLEDAGLAGMHIEDQVNPKRCGHLDGKEVVGDREAVNRIRAAVQARRDSDFLVVARTDIRGVAGVDAACERVRRLVDAGADAVFPEALSSLREFEAIRAAVDVPILANMTEFGKSPLFTVQQLADVGVDIVIFPVSLLRLAMGAIERGLDALNRSGSLESELPSMMTRAELYELVDYAGYAEFDSGVYTFDLANNDDGSGNRRIAVDGGAADAD